MKPAADPLARYRSMRDFARTPEPRGEGEAKGKGSPLVFVVQKHAATRLHYDFRLELDGVMLSWAVPKGPSYDPADKRMAVQTEDHPISYNTFEGVIPKGQYGAGSVIVWDRGHWIPEGDPHKGLADGKLVFTLRGHKLAGRWELVRIKKPGEERQIPWILFKKNDADARPRAEYDVISALPDSVNATPLPLATSRLDPAGGAIAEAGAAGAPHKPSQLSGAVKAALPATMAPQLATATTELPRQGDWLFEIKLDGYRIMARIDGSEVRLVTRGGHDWTSKMPEIAADLKALKLKSAWLDGEVVVLGDDGLPHFNALQNAFDRRRSGEIVYFLFDVPYLDGHDLRAAPLRERRALLSSRLSEAAGALSKPDSRLRYSESFNASPHEMLRSAQQLNLEGVMAKRADAPYVSRRTETWLKLKTRLRQEFVVAGYTDRGGEAGAREIGSLVLGVHDNGRLVPVGSVGTGWNAQTAADLKERLLALASDKPPFDAEAAAAAVQRSRWSRRNAGQERWVKPQLVVEVTFAEWTPEDQIRHATFEGLRIDKPAAQVVREYSSRMPIATSAAASKPTQTKVTHGERVIDASTGLTKLDLVRYYESVAEWMVPHLKGRPCSLVRGPDGIAGQLFFQKHLDKMRFADVRELPAELWPDHAPMLEVPSGRAIAAAAQLNVIEFHTWNATTRHIDKPDRVIFDLDPGSGVAWPRMIEAAALTRGLLQELGLESWLKTSGGKGLHVVVPLAPRHETAVVKEFAHGLVQHLAAVIPERFVAKSGSANRVGKIFVDYLRNSQGATTVAAFSARARPGLGVSMPVGWEALSKLKSGAQWTIANAREHLSFGHADPWADYWGCRQTLTQAIKRLGVGAADGKPAAKAVRKRTSR